MDDERKANLIMPRMQRQIEEHYIKGLYYLWYVTEN